MVARFFYGNPIEEEVARLTSEEIPNHELELHSALNLADKVRSKEYNAKDVARILRKRLNMGNPNIAILTLKLTDILVKNGGGLIQLELFSREYIDSMVNLLNSKHGHDYELRDLILKLIQDWASVSKANPEMGYVSSAYKRLKGMGHSFPKPEVSFSIAMAEADSAPEWEDSQICQRCRTAFSFTNRKHHCRHCGKCFCSDCSSNSIAIPKFAIYDPVRVCHGCYLRLKKIIPDTDKEPTASPLDKTTSRQPAPSSAAAWTKPATSPVPNVNDEDEDLKRAIELSLQESQNKPNYADYTLPRISNASTTAIYGSSKPTSIAQPSSYSNNEPHQLTSAPENPADYDEDSDPDLRAAIEASLRDVQGNSMPDYLPMTDSRDHYEPDTDADVHTTNFMPAVDDYNNDNDDDDMPLTTTEHENVQLFESLLTRIKESGQDIRYDPQVQYLHESIESLHPKITDAIDQVDQKHKEFLKLHDRIITAIKIYDQLLERRLKPSNNILNIENMLATNNPYTPQPQPAYPATTPNVQNGPRSQVPIQPQSQSQMQLQTQQQYPQIQPQQQPPQFQPQYHHHHHQQQQQQQQQANYQHQSSQIVPHSPHIGPSSGENTVYPYQQTISSSSFGQQVDPPTSSGTIPTPYATSNYPVASNPVLQQQPAQNNVGVTPRTSVYAQELAEFSSSQPQPSQNPQFSQFPSNVPGIPALQPTSATKANSASSAPVDAQVAPEAVGPEQNEAPLIEF